MDTRRLAAFCAVVERRSFSLAAADMGITQPAVSQQIQTLEQQLGRPLLDRSARHVEPTEAGQHVYRTAMRILALEEQLRAELDDPPGAPLAGKLKIGASTGPGQGLLPLVLAEFQRNHSGVRITLQVADSQHIVEAVARHELQLGLVGAARRRSGVSFEPFFHDEIVLAVPAGHDLAGREITVDELKAAELVMMQDGAGVRQVVEEALRAAGIRLTDLNFSLELGLQESVRQVALAGFAMTFISRAAVEPDVAAGRLAIAQVEGLDLTREIMLVRSSSRTPSRITNAFVKFASEKLS